MLKPEPRHASHWGMSVLGKTCCGSRVFSNGEVILGNSAETLYAAAKPQDITAAPALSHWSTGDLIQTLNTVSKSPCP